ncbi:hypothetical protein TrCOL_g13458, partial [Triparma columacea]
MSTKDSPQQEDKHIVARSDVENGLQDHEKTIDFPSEANEGLFGAPEDVIDSIDDNNMENGRVFRVDDPPDGLKDNENSVEEKAEENKASLAGIGGATQTDEEIDRAVGCATPSHTPVGLATDSLATAAQSMTLDPDNTVRNKDPPQPLSIPNHTPSAIHGFIDIDFAALGPVQGKLVKLLEERGAVEGLIDNSNGVDVKVMELAGVFHDERDKIIDFLLTDCEQGKFRRKTLQEYDKKEGVVHRLVCWQHCGSGNKFVEFLLDVKVVSPDKSRNIMELAPLDEDDLSDEATTMLVKILASIKTKTVKRGVIKGKLSFTDFEFGQTAVTMVGTLKAEERVTETKSEVDVHTVKSFKSIRSMRSSFEGSPGRPKKGDVKAAYAAVKGIMGEVRKKFRQPGVIDERRKRNFVEEVMPRAPPLTREEEAMLEGIGKLEEELHTKGKRVKGTLKEGIDKFLWRDGDNVWAAFGVTVDKSAKGVLAEEFLLDTFARSEAHFKNNGNLPRTIRKDVDGTRSVNYHVGKKVPAATNRLFENWFVWKEAKLDNGQTTYMIGFVPLREYYGASLTNLSKDGFVVGVTRGIYIMAEVAPNVCRVTRIQTVDLKFSGIHKTVMDNAIDYLAKNQLVEANRLQEKFKRNSKKVDAEVRGALVEKMREGVELEEDQKTVFGELEKLFGREGDEGWRPLKSPYEGVKMEIKYKQQEKGQRSITLAKASGVADCSAEEAAAWFFEYCSRERTTKGFATGELARLEIREGTERTNEKKFATVKQFPFLITNREFVQRLIWRRNNTDCVTVAVWSIDKKVDYGGLGKLVRGATKAIFTITNIQEINGFPQCKIELMQHVDAGDHLPGKFVEKLTPKVMGVLKSAIESFERDEEVDKAALGSLANTMKYAPQMHSAEEDIAVEEGLDIYESCTKSRFDVLKSPDKHVEMKAFHIEGESLGTCLARTVVDASIEECTAHQYYLDSRMLRNTARERGIVDFMVEKVNDHTLYYFSTRNLGVPGLSKRQWRSKITWKRVDNGKIVMVVADTLGLLDKSPILHVLGSGNTIWIFEALPSVRGMPQTAVTFTGKVNLGGAVPTFIMNMLASRFLSQVSDLRKRFDKSQEIDKSKRLQVAESLQRLTVTSIKGLDDALEDVEGAIETSSLSFANTATKAVGGGKGWGKTTVTMRSTLEEVVAYFWNVDSRFLANKSKGTESKVETKTNNFEMTVRTREKLESEHHFAHHDREYLSNVKLLKPEEDTFILTVQPVAETAPRGGKRSILQRRSTNQERGRGTLLSVTHKATEATTMRFTKVGDKETKVEMVTNLDVGTHVAGHGVDEWAHQFPAVQELELEYSWLRPMLETISYKLVGEVGWGLKARVFIGAATSMLDLLTDIYVTYKFWKDRKQRGYFKASLVSLAVSIGIQMFTVWAQNRKLGMKRVLREWFPILIGFKPAVDAYRVATGAKQEVGASVDPMMEMSTTKAIEMFAEAIPGVIIQLMAIVTSDKDVGTSAWLSLAMSAIATGFASATLSYDWDTDPGKREQTPEFYGYIPANASKRTIVFVLMLLLSVGMLLVRCTTIVLLGLMGGSWVFLYIGADLGLYLLVKILRGDFWYWMPIGGKAEI